MGENIRHMKELIAKLEVAPEGSRGLDLDIAASIGAIDWDDVRDTQVDSYTTSIDAAMTLVLEGLAWTILSGAIQAACVGEASTGNPVTIAATPALALCIAALKAKSL